MHIAAVMAVLKMSDLDHQAKHALLVVCCRANRHTAIAAVSAARAAADMKVARNTAAAALSRVVDSGYLSVDKCLGKTSRWQVNLLNLGVAPAQQLCAPPAQQLCATEDSMDTREGESGRAAPRPKPGKPDEVWVQDLPPNPWIYDDQTGEAHRLTVDDILNTPRVGLDD
jgi:hypothetical protein